MGIEELISWYQKKIGTYDKQQWEKTVEQRIIHGLTHIQLKTAKPKTDLIDLDLVRGSSFTKAKPKHGFITVARLSTLRFLFLPIYSKWWVQQTSGKIFGLLLLLYLLQLINLAIYSYNTQNVAENSSQNVPTSELLVPIIMMWVLSFILSQIVATSSGSESLKTKPKFRKNYRRVRRSRKLNLEKAAESNETVCIDGRNSRRSGMRNNWKSKDNLVKNTKNKNVLFEENVNIAENSNTNPKININVNRGARRIFKRQPLDDDGFESLNGNGSSPSDNGEDPVIPTKASLEVKNAAEKDGSNASGLRCNEWVKSVQGTREALTLNRRQSAPDLLPLKIDELDTDSDTFTPNTLKVPILKANHSSKSCSVNKLHFESTCETDEEGECETISSPETIGSGAIEANTSATEWIGVTTNSEDCSYSSDLSESDAHIDNLDIDAPPTYILSHNCGPSDRVSCTIWDMREIKKADLSVIEISSVIIARVETMPESRDYFYLGVIISFLLAILPILCRLCTTILDSTNIDEVQITLIQLINMVFDKFSESFCKIFDAMLGTQTWVRTLTIIAATQRWILGFFLFFLMAVAERSFKQRFLYAKLFSHLTSSRRARKSELPHFRLHKVRNIKTWLSVRSYLKKRGPQRSVDVIVSATFISMLLLLSFVCMELIKESFTLNSQYNLEMLIWIFGLGIFIMRYMTLGVKINKKYRNLSVLITEQINLYLQIEQKPHKKEELMVANSVLKLAADLLKELESQFKILGLSANPFLYNITKVVILSALSGILSELLGFKLKLHKISIK